MMGTNPSVNSNEKCCLPIQAPPFQVLKKASTREAAIGDYTFVDVWTIKDRDAQVYRYRLLMYLHIIGNCTIVGNG